MNNVTPLFLTVNAGSSSVKVSVFTRVEERVYEAAIEGIGFPEQYLTLLQNDGTSKKQVHIVTHTQAVEYILEDFNKSFNPAHITAVGHRIVYGGSDYSAACELTDGVVAALTKLISFDPTHLPVELELVRHLQHALPAATHIACFDTAFHHNLPRVAQLLPLPRSLLAKGLRRYGFHGLSCRYLLDAIAANDGEQAARGRIIIAHLGNGASLTAVQEGRPVDTSMGFSPSGGIPMSTRSGDIDPGIVTYLSQQEGLSADEIDKLLTFKSGLLGVSEATSDMEKLLQLADTDVRARDAVDLFCHQAKKYIGAYAAVMGGLDMIVFSGGMGEHAPKIRARICEDLDFLGLRIDAAANDAGQSDISAKDAKVCVRVVHTDEAVAMLRDMQKIANDKS